MENNIFFSILNWNEIEPIINKFQMKRETFNILRNANTSGYDLIMNYINNKFLDNIGLNSLHEKNLINQQISNFVIDLLKIKFLYQNKLYFIQLDLDIDYTIEELTKNIKNLFNINNEIYLTVHSQMNFNNNKNIKEVLLPNFKIIKHIIENPEKYFIFEIYEPKENFINFNFNNSNYNSYFSFNNNNNNNNIIRKNDIFNSNLNSQDISYNNSIDLTSGKNSYKNFNNPEIINNYNNLNNKKNLNINNALDIDENPLLSNSQTINREKDFRESKDTKKLNNSNSCRSLYTPNNRNYVNKEINKNKKMNCILNNNLQNMNYNNNMNNFNNNNNFNYQKNNNNNNSEFNNKREKERIEINNYVKKGYGINDNTYNQENNNNNKISEKKIYNSHTPDNRKEELKNMNQKDNNNELNNSFNEIYINKNNYRNSHTSKRDYKYNKIKINDDKNGPITDRSNKSFILNNNNNNFNQNNENNNNNNNNNNNENNNNNKEDNLHSKIKMMKNQISELSSNILNDNKENNNIINNNDEKKNIENIKNNNNNINNNIPIKIINTGISRRSYIDNYKSDNHCNNFQLKHLTNKYGGYGLNSNSPIKNDNYLKVSYNYEKKNIKNNVSKEDFEKE